MGNWNIGYQIERASVKQFRLGQDKHSAKASGSATGTEIWSGNQLHSVVQCGHEFGKYMKSNFPDVKQIRDCRLEHYQGFLEANRQNWSPATMHLKISLAGKISAICSAQYRCRVDLRTGLITPTGCGGRERGMAITTDDYGQLRAVMRRSTTRANIALDISEAYGLRVREAASLRVCHIDLDSLKLRITKGPKGGRDRVLDIDPRHVPMLRRLIEGKARSDLVVGIRSGSVNKAIARAMKAAGLREKYPVSNNHAVRKMAACEYYRELRAQGFDPRAAADRVGRWLGHGPHRWELLRKYYLGEVMDDPNEASERRILRPKHVYAPSRAR